MAEEQEQRDFFTDLMFGRPQSNESSNEQTTAETEQYQEQEEAHTDQHAAQQNGTGFQPTPNQLDAILSLAQSLAPLFSVVQGWLTKKSKDDKEE